MLYGSDYYGLYVDKSLGYYYSLRIFPISLTISGNDLAGNTLEVTIWRFNIRFSLQINDFF